MRFSSQSTSGGVRERLFTVGDPPGILWAPDSSQRFFARHLTSATEGRP